MPITVFIVDDHPIMCDGLTHLLHVHEDIRVVGTASNGRDAVRAVLQLLPDVVITDIAMPGMNGVEATRQIGERCPDTRVLILSMHATPDHVRHGLEAGARGYVLKACAGSEIVKAVRAVHAGRRYFSPEITELLAEQITRRGGASPLDSLSKREREILQLIAEGRSSVSISTQLNLSPQSVSTYRSRLMRKLQINDVAGLVKFAIQHGLTTLD